MLNLTVEDVSVLRDRKSTILDEALLNLRTFSRTIPVGASGGIELPPRSTVSIALRTTLFFVIFQIEFGNEKKYIYEIIIIIILNYTSIKINSRKSY